MFMRLQKLQTFDLSQNTEQRIRVRSHENALDRQHRLSVLLFAVRANSANYMAMCPGRYAAQQTVVDLAVRNAHCSLLILESFETFDHTR